MEKKGAYKILYGWSDSGVDPEAKKRGRGGGGGDDDDICVVTVSDAATKNSLDRTSLRELAGTVARESTRSSSRHKIRIVLTGEGDAFSSGIDLKRAPEVFGMDEFDYESDPVYQMEKCEIPIICVVAGVAINAGFERISRRRDSGHAKRAIYRYAHGTWFATVVGVIIEIESSDWDK